MQRHVIRQLDPLVIGKIAAGEVVERPAFAIKELIENSIDAGSTSVAVEIRDGGLTYFRVTDNGCGIAAEDVRMAFARHATSKLRNAEELQSIHTLGFRGEALASIAAVARVEMKTRAQGAETGVKAVVAGGVIESIQEAASPEGTTITVRDLFFNVPARQKFLKQPATEAGYVSDLVMRLILSRPDISFRLSQAERVIYQSPGNGNLKDALFSVVGREALSSLVEVRGSAAGCALYGFIGVGTAARSSRSMQTFVLNGRYVRGAALSQALEEACRERVMIGKYPICALHLTMPFEAVDVNVHPNKLEVRFQDERTLAAGLAGVMKSAFEVEPMKAAPPVTLPVQPKPKEDTADAQGASFVRNRPDIPLETPANRPSVRLSDSAVALPPRTNRPSAPVDLTEESVQETVAPTEKSALPLRTIGVAWFEYVFVEQGETLFVIDQHAAHERILYERYRRALDQEAASQQLLVPQAVQMTHREHAALLASGDLLRSIGLDLEDFGDRTVQVRAVPLVLGVPQLGGFLSDLADSLIENKALPTDQQRRDVLIKLACRKAVKAGDALPLSSIDSLIQQMLATGAPPTCPHGRPLVVRIDKTELDKWFRRIVS